jgi:hypothetical protein
VGRKHRFEVAILEYGSLAPLASAVAELPRGRKTEERVVGVLGWKDAAFDSIFVLRSRLTASQIARIKVHGVLCFQGEGLGANSEFQLPRDQLERLHSRMLMRPRFVSGFRGSVA